MRAMLVYFLVFDVSFALALLFTPMFRKFSHSWGFLDEPDAERKFHTTAMPLLGGFAVFAAFALNVMVGAAFNASLAANFQQLAILVGGGAAMLVLGAYDDKHDLKAGPKLLGQVAIASLVWFAGMRITLFIDNALVSYLLTVFWIVAVTNALNFLDNMDGLCAGVGIVCALLFAFIAGVQEQSFVCLLALALAGALLGFLPHNFKPATIFLGDSGSHFIGFMLAVLPVMTTFYREETAPTHLPVLIPLLVLAVPLFDMVLVSWRRWRRGQGVGVGDTTHISHRLVKLGLPESWAVTLIYLLTLTLGLGATILLWSELTAALIVFVQAICILATITLLERLGSK